MELRLLHIHSETNYERTFGFVKGDLLSPRPRSVSDEEILAAVGQVIGRDGPARLTIAAVAAVVGLAPSSLVQRFGSRRGLLLAFAEGGPAHLAAIFARARAAHTEPLGALRAALDAMTEGIRTVDEMSNHLAMLQIDLGDPEFRRHAVAHGRLFRREAAALIAAAIERGEVAGQADERAIALQVAFNGALVTWAIHGGRLPDLVDRVLPIALGIDQ